MKNKKFIILYSDRIDASTITHGLYYNVYLINYQTIYQKIVKEFILVLLSIKLL